MTARREPGLPPRTLPRARITRALAARRQQSVTRFPEPLRRDISGGAPAKFPARPCGKFLQGGLEHRTLSFRLGQSTPVTTHFELSLPNFG
jgi:hypothetical protein